MCMISYHRDDGWYHTAYQGWKKFIACKESWMSQFRIYFHLQETFIFLQLPKFPSKYQNALEEISQPFNFPTYSSPLVVLTVGTRSYFILVLVLRMCQMTWLGSLYFKKKKNLHTFNLSPTVDTVNLLLWNSASPLLPFCAF